MYKILGIILLLCLPSMGISEPIDLKHGEKVKVESLTQMANEMARINNLPEVEIWVEHPNQPWPYAHYYYHALNVIIFSTQMMRMIKHNDEFKYLVALMLVDIYDINIENPVARETLSNWDLADWLLRDLYKDLIAVDYLQSVGGNPQAAINISNKLFSQCPSNLLLFRGAIVKQYIKLKVLNNED